MRVTEAEVYEAFKAIGIPDDKASAVAQALGKPKPEFSTLVADVATLKSDVASLKTSLAVLQWGAGIAIASVLSLVAKAFLHSCKTASGRHIRYACARLIGPLPDRVSKPALRSVFRPQRRVVGPKSPPPKSPPYDATGPKYPRVSDFACWYQFTDPYEGAPIPGQAQPVPTCVLGGAAQV